MRKLLSLIVLILLSGLILAQTRELLSPAETAQLEEMLQSARLERASLCFEKDWDLSTKFKLDWQLNQLQNPWQAFADLQELRTKCVVADSLPASLPLLLQTLGGIAWNLNPALFKSVYANSKGDYSRQFQAQVRKPEQLFDWLLQRFTALDREFSSATAELTEADRRQLTAFWLWQFIESEDIAIYTAYYKEQGLPASDSLDTEAVYKLMARMHFSELLETGIRFLALSDAVVENAALLKFNNKKPLTRKTEFGLLVLGTKGDDFYAAGTNPVCFLLDPGGDDRYELELRAALQTPFYLFADLAGNDLYRSSTPGGMFCSTFGYGYSYDLGGNDIYQTDDFSFAAFMGLNLHQDYAGDDTYRGGLFAQGAAMFGVSLLLDRAGNDIYQAQASSQGIGSTYGVGALLDQSGTDSYLLGGKYFHEPLMPLDHITLGQGMGLGLRPGLAGGLGLLYDRSGNDKYLGGVYAQGSGYWYATGALLDEAGNDVYNTVYYPQGTGIHLACGFLLDGAGDDAYYSRMGPGQGAGHDWALGMLIDEAGNDAYSIQGGNGLGLTNSVGIFIDKSGDDRYERNDSGNYGNANLSRSTGGIGLFLDAGGKDTYPDSLKTNNTSWQNGTYGIGRDIELNVIAKSAVEELAEAAALPDSTDSIDKIFDAAAEWEVGSAVQRVRVAREILLRRADEAIPYILANKMATDSGLEYRALETMAQKNAGFVRQLFPLLEAADSLAAKNSLSLIAGVGDTLLVQYIDRLLQRKSYITACLSALAGINSPRSVEILRDYIHHPLERYRYITARSLMQNKDPSARQTLALMREDRSFLVQALLRNLPPEPQP